MSDQNFISVLIVTIGIALVVYALDSLYARRWLTIERRAVAYISAAILIGIFGEVLVESVYGLLLGEPLWYYKYLPVHDSFTSQFSVVLWGMFGLHIYWANLTLRERYPALNRLQRAVIFSVESLLLESFVNLVWLGVFGYLIYYYTPADFAHVTAWQNIPCYFGASWAILVSAKRFSREPWFFASMAGLIAFVFLFLK
ncbi:MAG TPA: hypothetical protein VL362_03580 [Patescibacteria group bacterium]|jgi:hypothetical protein|nr:hypothetical protein [Patescibacteria group bacterium]